MGFQPFCRIRNYPGPVKLLLGVVFLVIGVPVFILPIPLGFVLIMAGTVLVISALRKEAALSAYLTRRFPRLIRRWEAISAICSPGPQGGDRPRGQSPPTGGNGAHHLRSASQNMSAPKSDTEPR
ncbi:MAG: hypothetical protein PVH30_09485 [Desulfobacterales bacterium]|jgi:hypothetical protein